MIMATTNPISTNASITQRSRSNSTSSPAVGSVVDAHASRILRINSPAEACIDPALGPYVTSILRCALERDSVIELDEIEEVDSLLELLEEHCTMDNENARSALYQIYMSVKTGIVDDFFGSSRLSARRGRGMSAGNEEEAIRLLGQMLSSTDIAKGVNNVNNASFTTLSGEFESCLSPSPDTDPGLPFEVDDLLNENDVPSRSADKESILSNSLLDVKEIKEGGNLLPGTPLKPTTLIPTDLLGVLDNPTTPAPHAHYASSTPDRTDPASMETPKIQNGDKKKDNSNENFPAPHQLKSSPQAKEINQTASISKVSIAQDLAATLFKTSRSRSNSILSDKSPKFKPMQAQPYSTSPPSQFSLNTSNEQLLESTVQILLSLNGALSEEAALEAAQVTNNDVNVAQFLLEKAMSAPPVCRHMLNNSCYRSDCQFSHDVEGHTCLFWLKGRCGKGDSCRFLHGFSEHLLDGMIKCPEVTETEPKSSKTKSSSIPITTTNLVQHNMSCSPQPFSFMPSSLDSINSFSAEEAFGGGAFSLSILQSAVPATPISTPNQSSMLSKIASNRLDHFETKDSNDNADSPVIKSFVQEKNDQLIPTKDRVKGRDRPTVQEKSPRSKTFSFAKVASKGYNRQSFAASKEQVGAESNAKYNIAMRSSSNNSKLTKFAKIPNDLWNPHYNRSSSLFHISDPMERYLKVNSSSSQRGDVIDLHFQSIKTFPVVLSRILPEKLQQTNEVWVVTGGGNYVNRNSHQRSGGVLETAVIRWLSGKGYEYLKGKDKNGYGGAVLVRTKR